MGVVLDQHLVIGKGRMNSKPDIVALVPMRHHSERVRGKNYRLLAGKPLYAHILESLIASSQFKEIVVDTDSPIVSEGVDRDFPSVRIIERPDHLRDGDVPMNEVLLNDIDLIASDFFLQTHSTNPLLRSETISLAIKEFFDVYPKNDSLFSVTKIQTRLWDEDFLPINHDPTVLLRTQDLPPIYEENSCLYIFERSTFLSSQNRIGARPLMYEIPIPESWDIDTELDFMLVDFLMRYRASPFPWEAE